MNIRIKKIRQDSGLTQEEFSKKIGTKRTNIAKYESGINEPSDAVISLICREFNVNESWLRTGEGEPYKKLQTDNMVATAASLLGRHDPMFEAIIETYSKLNDDDKEFVMNILDTFVETYKKKKEQ